METALARLGATYLRLTIERSQFQHDKDSSLSALLEGFSPEHSSSASFETADEITENPTNTSGASEASEPPAASTVAHVLKPSRKPESDLFRADAIRTLKEQYLRWKQIRVEDNRPNSAFDRVVTAASRLNMLKDEPIGSKPLEMTYYSLFSHYRQYKLGNDVASMTIHDTILQQVYSETWDQFSGINKRRHRDKLCRQLNIGRRWAVAIDQLSHDYLI
ncbi:hypothetical protein APSETT444_000002 [Aspergillus pseudonomiae]